MTIDHELEKCRQAVARGDVGASERLRILEKRVGIRAVPKWTAEEVALEWDEPDKPGTIIIDALAEAEVIYHAYQNWGYEGSILTVFVKDGRLYEAHGSHCSCDGLMGQWDPELTTLKALKARMPESLERATSGQKEILKVIERLEAKKDGDG